MNTRLLISADFPDVLRLNEESVHYLSPLTKSRLEEIHRQSELRLIVESENTVLGFLIAIAHGAEYDSVNYGWFAKRYESFLYIDRIVVSTHTQTKGAGSRLYREVFKHAKEHGFPLVCCEYDIQPPNPASAAFHSKFGFSEVGKQRIANGSKVVSLQVASAPFNNEA